MFNFNSSKVNFNEVEKTHFAEKALKNQCISIIWGGKKYQVRYDRSEVFRAIFENCTKKLQKAKPLDPENYDLSKTHSDAIIFSLKQNRIHDLLKEGGWEALREAIVFAEAFNCQEFRQKLFIYFATEFLFLREFSLQEIKDILKFLKCYDLHAFKKHLVSSALIYHKKWDEHLDKEYEKIFSQPVKNISINLKCHFEQDEKKQFALFLPLLGPKKIIDFATLHIFNRFRLNIMSSCDYPVCIFDYLESGGSADKLIPQEEDDFRILRLLQNSKALKEFVKCGGKFADLYKCDQAQIYQILNNIEYLKKFQQIGGSLEKLYTLHPVRIALLLRNVAKIPAFIEQGGTLDNLYIINGDATVEYLLKYTDKIPLFKAVGGNLEDLYHLPKERNSVEGCKVRVLLKQVECLQLWTQEGRSLHEFFPCTVDSGVLSLFLENLPQLKNSGIEYSEFLKMDYTKLYGFIHDQQRNKCVTIADSRQKTPNVPIRAKILNEPKIKNSLFITKEFHDL